MNLEFLNYRTVQLWAPVAVYMGGIFFVSSLHQAPLPPGLPDKPAHAIAYTGLGFLIARALAGGLPPRLTRREVVLGLVIAISYAASDEFHQRFVPGRSADIADVSADAIGSAIALMACWAWGIIAPRGRHQP